MGYYINRTPKRPLDKKRKAEFIHTDCDAQLVLNVPKSLSEIPADKALICVVDNGPFEAAALAFDDRELEHFTWNTEDERPKTWLMMDKKLAYELTGFKAKS